MWSVVGDEMLISYFQYKIFRKNLKIYICIDVDIILDDVFDLDVMGLENIFNTAVNYARWFF